MFTTITRTIFPMIFGRRHPEKLSDGTTTPLQLIRLQIEQKVNANFPLIHQVATTMTFKNTHNIVLEGAFEFTLPENATICGYGLDVDGVIVDGVIVEKQASRIIFEKEVRKRIDPGFVELVTGNVFRTRVYPINPQQTRTVRVIYQDQGLPNMNDFHYHIPLQFQTTLESLDVVLTCFEQGSVEPYVLTNPNHMMSNSSKFSHQGNGKHVAEWHLTNVQPSGNGEQTLVYVLPNSLKPVISAIEKNVNLGAYFAVSCTLPKPTERRKDQLDIPTKTICLLWDASLSRSNSKESRLLELYALKKIFDVWLTRFPRIEIIWIIFRNDMKQPELYQLQFHNWNHFMQTFENLSYDGATNLSQISTVNLTQTVDYYFLFSDCISTIGDESSSEHLWANLKAPIWIFNGNQPHEPYDVDFVRYLTQYHSHGGGYFNRDKLLLNSNDLINIIETVQIKYVKLHSETTVQQIYPSDSINISLDSDRFLLVGQIPKPLLNSLEFELEFAMNNQTTRLPISLDISTDQLNFFGLIRRLWAQQKLNQLNAFKDKYRTEILLLGMNYSLVTQFTSLLVLETLQQHLQYRVCPAKTRTVLYNEYMQQQTKETQKKESNQANVLQQWNTKCQWFDRTITDADRHRAYLRKSVHMPITDETPNERLRGTYFAFGSHNLHSSVANQFSLPPSQSNSYTSSSFAAPSFSSTFTFGGTQNQLNSANSSNDSLVTGESTTINLPDYNSQSSSVTRLSSASDRHSAYLIYLNERTSNRQPPSFYFDMASFFLSPTSASSTLDQFNQQQEPTVQKLDVISLEYGLRILTNILELEFEAPQLYRTVGYKLIELKQWNLALNIFQKVYSLRPDEPHSLYDLATVSIELGQYEQAYEYFKQILTQTWDARFRTIPVVVLSDLNRLLVLMNRTTGTDIDFRFVRHLPTDIRIVVQWDTADTVIQLSVDEPTGQICSNYSGSSQTDIGGFIVNSPFQVDQPVEYLLRTAITGRYSIHLTYVSNAQHALTGVTTVLLTIYKHFGSINEEKQTRTLRLTSLNQTINAGYLEFSDMSLEKLKEELAIARDECRRLQDRLITSKNHSSIQHLNITCDGCSKTPIVGDRYKCLFCPNVDICDNCHSSANHQHDSTHPFICIRDSTLYASSIYTQNMSQLVHMNVQCASCSVSPITGIRYHCVQCQINVCEKCEFLGLHNMMHQRLKIIYP
ncbi:unnamed protein product [Adineta ricciae]|uniref:Uncharacterized protein n=1 Tax=Adineta ricciae TaxID=249248 RepID=A0A813TTI9_ADIRI|nr:unnamed protein product [Adineta ricciae]CAF0818021.1 unnamed protein product [Adineta ricciae]